LATEAQSRLLTFGAPALFHLFWIEALPLCKYWRQTKRRSYQHDSDKAIDHRDLLYDVEA
jgi:hypothetical protein